MLREQLMRWLFRDGGGPSYSQSGEDRIVKYVLDVLGVAHPTYLDIGAHHPVRISNTYLFYENGSKGVCVEPNPSLYLRLRQARPRDTCLNIGVGGNRQKAAPFYELDSTTLSTFSESEARRYVEEHGKRIVHTAEVDIITPAEIIGQHFQAPPDFVSLDVEGLELEILEAFDLSGARPAVFCVETITYST
ncbi:MAG: FkbM family methyltransferase, partial [Gammaproteobacteria bacterium]